MGKWARGRLWLRCVAALAIGVVINLGVAWWVFFVWTPPVMKKALGTPGRWVIPVPREWPAPDRASSVVGEKLGLTFRGDQAQVQYPRDPLSPLPTPVRCEYRAFRFASGLPMRSFAAYWWVEDDAEKGRRSGLVAVRNSQRRATPTIRDGMLPIVPVWPGFAVNTLVFAGPLLVWWCVLPWWRARSRRRSGRCAGCGYELKGAGGVCPECGG